MVIYISSEIQIIVIIYALSIYGGGIKYETKTYGINVDDKPTRNKCTSLNGVCCQRTNSVCIYFQCSESRLKYIEIWETPDSKAPVLCWMNLE